MHIKRFRIALMIKRIVIGFSLVKKNVWRLKKRSGPAAGMTKPDSVLSPGGTQKLP